MRHFCFRLTCMNVKFWNVISTGWLRTLLKSHCSGIIPLWFPVPGLWLLSHFCSSYAKRFLKAVIKSKIILNYFDCVDPSHRGFSIYDLANAKLNGSMNTVRNCKLCSDVHLIMRVCTVQKWELFLMHAKFLARLALDGGYRERCWRFDFEKKSYNFYWWE